jgi:hypothetical protein
MRAQDTALRAQRADAGRVRPRFVRALAALGAALLACPVHATAAQGFPFPSVPSLERVRHHGSVHFNVTDPRPRQVHGSGVHRLVGHPMGQLYLESQVLPSPYIRAAAGVANGFFGTSLLRLTYQAMVVGRDTTLPIRIDVGGRAGGSVFADPGTGAFLSLRATWSFASPSEFHEGGIVVPNVFSHFDDSFHEIRELTVRTNQALNLTLFAEVAARGGTMMIGGVPVEVGTTGIAYIDPVFSFGPGVGPEYSFVFSDGVGNVPISSVPEPSTLALLAAGLLAVSGLGTRARRAPRAALAREGCK